MRIKEEPPSFLSMLDPLPSVRAIADHDVLETLVDISGDGLSPIPELAETWSISEDQLEYTFDLDAAARWHDGRPVTARDVEFTFTKLLDPDTRTILRSRFSDLSTVRADNDRSISFLLDRPRADFFRDLSLVTILPAHIFEQSPLATNPASRLPIGSGPFVVKKWLQDRLIVLERNQSWRGRRPRADRIEYHIIAEHRVALGLFERGLLDIVADLPVATNWKSSRGHVVYHPQNRLEMWVFNAERTIFSKPEIRQALSMLIDRPAIRCSIFRCRADLIESPWLPENLRGATGVEPLAFDPPRARAILQRLGWKDTDGNGIRQRGGVDLSFTVLIPEGNRDRERAFAVVRDDFTKAGVQATISLVSNAKYLRRLSAREFDIAVVEVPSSPVFDPWVFFHSAASSQAGNFGEFADEALDTLVDELNRADTDERRFELKKEIIAKLHVDHPVTFTFRPYAAFLVSDDLKGFSLAEDHLSVRDLFRAAQPMGERR